MRGLGSGKDEKGRIRCGAEGERRLKEEMQGVTAGIEGLLRDDTEASTVETS